MEIIQVNLAGGELAAAVELPMEPYGTRLLYTEDDTAESRERLRHLKAIWPRLWLEIRERIEDRAREIDLDEPIDGESLVGYASALRPGIFMADRCDTFLSLGCDGEAPNWDSFLKDGQIIHFQPVF